MKKKSFGALLMLSVLPMVLASCDVSFGFPSNTYPEDKTSNNDTSTINESNQPQLSSSEQVNSDDTSSEAVTSSKGGESSESSISDCSSSEDQSYSSEMISTSSSTSEEHIHELITLSGIPATCTEPGLTDGQKCITCGQTVLPQSPIKELGHDLEEHKGVDATCTDGGYGDYVSCRRCDYTTYSAVQPTGHSFHGHVSNGDATCTHDGTKTAVCDHCEETETLIDAGSKLEHRKNSLFVIENAIAAKCESEGSHDEVYYCLDCGVELERNNVVDSRLGHSFGDYVSDSNATCEHDGTKTALCTRNGCGETDTVIDEGTTKEHKSGASVEENTIEAACLTAGSHDEVYYCDDCGFELLRKSVVDEPTGHSFSKYVSNSDATCTENGTKTAQCDHAGCGETETVTDYGSTKGHVESSQINYEQIDADCENDGKGVYSTRCMVCDEKIIKSESIIKKLGHTFTSYVSDNNATCTRDGTKTAVCDREGCAVTDTMVDEGTRKEHTVVKDPATNTDCVTYGKSKGAHCSECGLVITEGESGYGEHNWEFDYDISQATCDKNGQSVYRCSICNDEKIVVTEAPHLPEDIRRVVIQQATCTRPGSESFTCALCGNKVKVTTDPAKGHIFDEDNLVVEKELTCSETGLYTIPCSRSGCEGVKEIVIPATGVHTEVKDTGYKETCGEDGLTDGSHCAVCGEVFTAQETISATGKHTLVKVPGKEPTCTEWGKTDGYRCEICGKMVTKQSDIFTKDHSYKNGKCVVCGLEDYVERWNLGTNGTEDIYGRVLKDGTTLVISGTGVMKNFSGGTRNQFASDYSNSIKKITIEPEVKSLGYNCLIFLPYVTTINYNAENCSVAVKNEMGQNSVFFGTGTKGSVTVNVGRFVKKIPNYLFNLVKTFVIQKDTVNNTKIKTLNFETGISDLVIGDYAFILTDIGDLYIPKGVISIGSYAFAYNSKLGGIHTAEDADLKKIEPYAFADDNLKYGYIGPLDKTWGVYKNGSSTVTTWIKGNNGEIYKLLTETYLSYLWKRSDY